MRTFAAALICLTAFSMSGCASATSEAGSGAEPQATAVETKPRLADFLNLELNDMVIKRDGNCKGYLDSLLLNYKATNVGQWAIAGISGAISISDAFGTQLKQVSIDTSKVLGVGKTMKLGTTGNQCFSLNSFDAGDNRILGTSSGERLELQIEIDTILFTTRDSVSFFMDNTVSDTANF